MKIIMSKITHGMEILFGLVGVLMILIETYAVFARNLFKIATPWSDELLKLLFVWSIFVCSALAFSSDSLISLTLLEDSQRMQKNPKALGVLKLFQLVTVLGISGLLMRQMCTIIAMQMRTGEITTVMKYPLWLLNLGIFTGMLMACVFAAVKIYDCKRYFIR